MTRVRSVLVPVAALALLALGARGARADIANAGSSVGGFLAVPPGAAAPGMAGTTLALSGDLAMATFNPASLGGLSGFGLALAHSQLPDGSRHEWAAVGGKLGPTATRWAITGLYAGQGSFEGRDAANQPTGSFGASSTALGVAFAQPLFHIATLGAGAKFVSENLASTSGSGFTFDAGLLARAGMIAIGASAQNVSGGIRYGGIDYSFPVNYGAGIAFEHPAGLRLEVDANFPDDYYNDVRAGAEYLWHDRFALRAGYRRELGGDPTTDPLDGPSFGIGAGVHGVWFDYAYLPAATGQSEQRVGLVLRAGRLGWQGRELGAKTAPAAAPATAENEKTKP